MAIIKPFKALHYNSKEIPNLDDVILPPYDVLSEPDKKRCRSRSPFNLCHVLLPKVENDTYEWAAEQLVQWKKNQVLVEDSKEYYYLYEQKFTLENQTYHRRSLFCLVQLDDFSKKEVLPHENVHGKYRDDRLNILRATQTNLSHIFGMVRDEEALLHQLFEQVVFTAPLMKAKSDDEIQHSVWKIAPEELKPFENFLTERPIYIVDGHHRYSSSVQYAKEKGYYGNKNHPGNYMLFAIVDGYSPSLVVFPTHRKIAGVEKLDLEGLKKDFKIEPFSSENLTSFVKHTSKEPEFVVQWGENFYLFTPKKSLEGPLESLSVYWSDEVILKSYLNISDAERSKRIVYDREIATLVESARNDLVIYHPSPSPQCVMEIADAGVYMPQKSTFFFPKLYVGLTMREIKQHF